MAATGRLCHKKWPRPHQRSILLHAINKEAAGGQLFEQIRHARCRLDHDAVPGGADLLAVGEQWLKRGYHVGSV